MQNYKLPALYMQYNTESKKKGHASRLAFQNWSELQWTFYPTSAFDRMKVFLFTFNNWMFQIPKSYAELILLL